MGTIEPSSRFVPEEQMQAVDTEREAIAKLVETATDAHDLYEIAARIRARKGRM